MGVVRRGFTGALIAASLAVSAPALAEVPVPTDHAVVIPGANFDAWAPSILEPIDPWATDGPLVPLINAGYYDCSGCAVTIVRYPRTAGPLFGPRAPYADESVAIGADKTIADLYSTPGAWVVSGLSLGAMVADSVQRGLDAGAKPPAQEQAQEQLTFIVTGDPTRVTPLTTGAGSFFPVGFRIPVLGWTVNRPASDSSYDTVVVVGEYDLMADAPDRPWNVLADLNALAGFQLNHSLAALTNPADVPAKYITSTTNSAGATTTTYLVPSPVLPLLTMFDRFLPTPVIKAANKALKPIVDRGYSRYDSENGNHMPYLQPTDGLPKLVRPHPTTEATNPVVRRKNAPVSRGAPSRTPAHTPRPRTA